MKLSEFDVKSGNWQSYCDRLDMYFLANSVKEELKLPTLIASMGESAYELLVNLTSPKKPSESTYSEVVKVMRGHLQPKPSVLAERYRFRQRRQNGGESISAYVAELRKLSRFCDFGDKLDENLRDQFACGIRCDVIRQRLFAENNMTFQKAVTLAGSIESAERDAAAVDARGEAGASTTGLLLAGSATAAAGRRSSNMTDWGDSVNRMQVKSCSVCGSYYHTNRECKFKDYECSRCGKVGHLRRVCLAGMNGGGGGPSATQNKSRGRRAAAGWTQRRGGGGGGSGRGGYRTPGPKVTPRQSETHWLEENYYEAQEEDYEVQGEDDEGDEPIYQMSLSQYKPVRIMINVNDVILPMEIDTGSPLSCINYTTFKEHFHKLQLQPCNLSVRFYNGTKVRPLGILEVNVTYNSIRRKLDLYVFQNGTTNLLGRQWLAELKLEIPIIPNNNVSVEKISSEQRIEIVNECVSRYEELFSEGLGCFTGGRASLRLRPGAQPVYCRARPLPYALRDRVDAELDAMQRAGVIEPVDSSDWATPLVIVHKPDGALRICADYKITLNRVLMVDKYPVPKIDDLLSKLSGCKFFTKLDLSQAYNQILLDDSKELTVVNTHKGLFKYNRLVYGLSSSPGIFQRIMVKLLENIPNTAVFLDDILIGTNNIRTHVETLKTVLKKLNDSGLKIKKQKCEFLTDEVRYLGFIINSQGVKANPDKIKPIIKLSAPTNVSEVKSFLGMINFYGKFIKNLSYYLTPLYVLLKKGKHWSWGKEQDTAFKMVKNMLMSSEVLQHYDESRTVVLTCDASARGVGAVLAQRDAAGREGAVAYASRALTPAENNYSQIHREALAIIFAVKKFHQYLYGRSFILRTDHKPLVSIFGSELGIPNMTASRLQRWALILSAYNFTIEYVNTNANTADALSRLVEGYRERSNGNKEEEEPEQTYLHFACEALLLSNENIRIETRKDPLLSRVLSYIRDGWPDTNEIKEIQPYFNRRKELYEELGCVMWGYRLVVPNNCREKILRELHDTHMGIVKTKSIARSYVWWAGLDEAVESMCRACEVCAQTAEAPPRQALQPWNWPSRPWTRLHVDFLGPLAGRKYLIMIDSYSKWIEICTMEKTTATYVITKMREIWSRFGLPKQVVSDNGPPFSSEEFNNFLCNNGIEHIYSAPYHPSSNGAAENAVKTCKRVIKKALAQGIDTDLALQRFLLIYRTIEHSTTGESPSKLLQGRTLRTRLDRLKPAREERVIAKQQRQQQAAGGASRSFQAGDAVWYRVYNNNVSKWLKGEVLERLGQSDYNIKTLEGTGIHRHVDQLKRDSRLKNTNTGLRCPIMFPEEQVEEIPVERSEEQAVTAPVCGGASAGGGAVGVPYEASSGPLAPSNENIAHSVRGVQGNVGPQDSSTSESRYPFRFRKPPTRYGFEID